MHLRSHTGLLVLSAWLLVSCGGDPPGSSAAAPTTVAAASNVADVVADAGPDGNSVNTLYTTVTVCIPGSTTQCQTIDHIQVDTGSYGLRLLAPVLTLALPATTLSDGNTLAECTTFVDGYSWGPVASADIQIAGETASSAPIQIIGASNFAAVPADCAGTGTAEDTVATFGANGILGIGVFEFDCSGCDTNPANGLYYSCSATTCASVAVPLANQVPNPVTLFATDSNGTVLVLPAVAGSGAASLTGSLIFGIDTESNNVSGSQTVLTLDSSGFFTTTYNGQPLAQSFIDSGTDGIFFNDSSIPGCTDPNLSGFYCPANTLNLTATLTGQSGGSTSVAFSVANADTLLTNNPTFTVFASFGGDYPGADASATFDWGLPFFYGRRVANAIEQRTTSVGTGPYVAF